MHCVSGANEGACGYNKGSVPQNASNSGLGIPFVICDGRIKAYYSRHISNDNPFHFGIIVICLAFYCFSPKKTRQKTLGDHDMLRHLMVEGLMWR